MTSTEARLALNLLPKIGPVRVQRLLEVFGTPQNILKAKVNQIQQVDGFGPELASVLANWENHIDLIREKRRIQEEGLTLLIPEDELFPHLLREIHDTPLILYVRGRITARDQHGISMVGVRRATQYGIATARKLAFQLAHAGYTIVSGLARGIDTAAHEGALASKGRTIAIIGAGHAKLYPPENAALADKITEQGAVISEFPVDFPPDKTTFPQRNRLVSGWSSGTIVVEASLRSGSLITANQAMDQGRTLFAVPGNIDRPSSQGCNKLIQQGAKLIMDGAEVLEELNILPMMYPHHEDELSHEQAKAHQASVPPQGGFIPEMSEPESAIYKALGSEEVHINELAQSTGLPMAALNTNLMKLEMKNLVRPLPGKYYVKLV